MEGGDDELHELRGLRMEDVMDIRRSTEPLETDDPDDWCFECDGPIKQCLCDQGE